MDSGSTSPRVNLSKLRDIVEDNLKLVCYVSPLLTQLVTYSVSYLLS